MKFPKIILGTMTFGEQNTIEEAYEQLEWAYNNGIRYLDTAEMYPIPTKAETQGRTEEYIGEWLKGKDRSSIKIATKVSGPGRKWIRGGKYTLDGIRKAIEGSLSRLGTDYVDLYQIHWPCRSVPLFGETKFVPPEHPELELPIEKQLEVFAKLIEEGLIKAVGLSNETAWGITKFVSTAEKFGLPKVVSTQNAYSLLNRQFEQGTDEACWREGVALLAYSPLAAGVLTGKYLKKDAIGRFTIFKGFSPRYTRPDVEKAVSLYIDIATRHGLTPEELALGFAASRPFVDSVILGATTLEQLKKDISACSVKLSDEVLSEIETVHAKIPNPAI